MNFCNIPTHRRINLLCTPVLSFLSSIIKLSLIYYVGKYSILSMSNRLAKLSIYFDSSIMKFWTQFLAYTGGTLSISSATILCIPHGSYVCRADGLFSPLALFHRSILSMSATRLIGFILPHFEAVSSTAPQSGLLKHSPFSIKAGEVPRRTCYLYLCRLRFGSACSWACFGDTPCLEFYITHLNYWEGTSSRLLRPKLFISALYFFDFGLEVISFLRKSFSFGCQSFAFGFILKKLVLFLL